MKQSMSLLGALFNPRSVAVIGASNSPGKIGHSVIDNLVASQFAGRIYPVNPKEDAICGLKCYRSVLDIPEAVDLAAIVVPAAAVKTVAEECGQKGVRFLVTITSGFREVGGEGPQRERELLEICRRHNMRMLGPNVLGLMDTHTPINLTFASGFPFKGRIAFVSQSGALLGAILDWSLANGLGFSKIVSLGNKADLTEADFIQDAAEDEYTKVILAYLEDVRGGQRFVDVVRSVGRAKPIVVLKSGISQAGAQAASSHTGALAGSDLAYETAFRQTGVLRARTMEELFSLAMAFATQPIPKGDRVAIITNSGGPGIVATDAVESCGLRMARFARESLDILRGSLPTEANIYNPVDLIGDATPERYRFAMETVLRDPSTDAALVLVTPTALLEPMSVARVIVEVRESFPAIPVLVALMGGQRTAMASRYLTDNGVPCAAFPEMPVRAIQGLVAFAQHRDAPPAVEVLPLDGVDKERVSGIFAAVRRDKRVVLLGSETSQVAEAYGIPAAPSILASSVDAAVAAAERLGYPVVMKVASPKILHKSDVGGVKLGVDTPEKVRRAFVDILDNAARFLPNIAPHGVEVQRMMPGSGTELIIGMTRDMQFGPLIMFGLGGIYVNLLKDVAFRLASGLSMKEIEAMIGETKAQVLLRGYRGKRPADVGAVADAVARVAQLVRDFPEISELDVNPLIAYEKGSQSVPLTALDVKITIS
jgi:acetyl coenzyme A synthetase (ADP forming)-like protein